MTIVGRPLPERVALPPLPQPVPTARAEPRLSPNATLADREYLTGTLARFVAVLDQPLARFEPGQYVSVGVSGGGAGGEELIQRPYSIVSIDAARMRIELFVRRVKGGQLSERLWSLQLGDRLRIGPAKGLFVLDSGDPRPRVMVATGTGLAPMLAMLESVAARRDGTPNVLIHGVSFQRDLAYRERINGWIQAGVALDFRPTVSRPDEDRNYGWPGRIGRAETQLESLLREAPELRGGGALAYLCGNAEMIAACTQLLRLEGFADADIRAEQFHAPAVRAT